MVFNCQRVSFATAWVLALCALASVNQALGLTADLKNDPADIVKKYLLLDKRGVRLQSLSYEAMKPYVEWKEEPLWGQVVVILDYTVSDDLREWEIINSTEAFIPVTFQILGVMHWEAATFLSEPREQKMMIRVRAVLNQWRISAPMFPPHVGRKRLIDFVRIAILEEKNEQRKETLERLRISLENTKS